jgi:hypothetical protein
MKNEDTIDYQIHDTKLGTFRTIPSLKDPNLLIVEKEVYKLGSPKKRWIDFGTVTKKDFNDFIKSNNK